MNLALPLFPDILENLGGDTRGKPSPPIHEYPFVADEIIGGLNLLYDDVKIISDILTHLKRYAQEKFGI